MAGEQTPKKEKKLTVLDEYKLRLVGDILPNAKRPPTLGFTLVTNRFSHSPQIVVRTNVEGDKSYGRIISQLDTPTFFAFLKCLKDTIDGPDDSKTVIKNLAARFINGKRSEPMPDTTIIVGKDKEGIVFIALTSWEKDRPIIKFPFRPTNLHSFLNGDGTPVTAGKLSQIYADAYVNILYGILPLVLTSEYVEPAPMGGNSGNSNYQRSEGRQSSSSSNASFADEWPS